MMAANPLYASDADLKVRLGSNTTGGKRGLYQRITGRDDAGTAQTNTAEECLQDAQSEVDSVLGSKFATVIATSNSDELARALKGWTLDIAEYLLHSRHPNIQDIPDRVKDNYRRVMDRLRAIRDGSDALPGDQSVPAPANEGIGAKAFGDTAVMVKADMVGVF